MIQLISSNKIQKKIHTAIIGLLPCASFNSCFTYNHCFFPACLRLFPPPTDEFKAFYTRLPQNYFLNVSAIQHLWSMDNTFQWRYEQLETSMRLLSRRAHRVIFKLFSLSKRCHRQPQVRLPTERSVRLPDRN